VWVVREWLGVVLAVQNMQKKTHFHENEHDGRHIYIGEIETTITKMRGTIT
jgi:hypothetical protein